MQGLRIKAAALSCLFTASMLWPIVAQASTDTLVSASSVTGKISVLLLLSTKHRCRLLLSYTLG